MGKVSRTPPLKQFREQVEQYVKVVASEANFYTDEEWIARIRSKIHELSEPINTGELALLGALIEVWGTSRAVDPDLEERG